MILKTRTDEMLDDTRQVSKLKTKLQDHLIVETGKSQISAISLAFNQDNMPYSYRIDNNQHSHTP